MKKTPGRLLEIASAVAEGLEVDWGALRGKEPALDDSLINLRRIEALARDFARVPQLDGTQRSDAGSRRSWGHLRLVEKLGEGSFGVVWRAFDPVLQREVALKLRRRLPSGAASDEAGGREFIDEARRLARVRHPNILGVHGADVHDGQVGLWTDLLESDTLESQLGREIDMPFDRQLAIARDLAQALQAVHSAELVHGDVKASNVAIEEDGRAVLLDFGASIDLSAAPGTSRSSYGSPLSSSPQRLRGGQLSTADDLWSLGVLLFRLACGGRYPFPASSLGELQSMFGRSTSVRWDGSSVPTAYRQLVAGLLDREASRRPPIVEILGRIDAISAAPAERRRRRGLAMVMASLSLGLLVATVGAWRARVAARSEASARLDAEETTRFLRDLLQAPSLTAAGEQVRVIEVLASAEQRLQATWPRESALRAQIWEILGGTYVSLRRFEEAEPLLEKAAADLERQYGSGHPLTLSAQLELAEVFCETRRPGRADTLLAQIQREAAPLRPHHEVHVDLAMLQGFLARSSGRTEEAQRHYSRAWDLRSDPTWRGDGARHRVIDGYGSALQGWGRFAELVEFLSPLVDELRETRGLQDGLTLSTLNTLAVALAHRNRRQESFELLALIDRTANEWLGEDHTASINLRGNHYTALREMGRAEEAIEPLERLLATALRKHGRNNEVTVMVENNLALALRDAGRTDESVAKQRELYERSKGAPKGLLVRLIVAVNYGEALLEQQKDPAGAVEVLVPLRAEFEPILGAGSYYILAVDSVLRPAQILTGQREALDQLEEVLEAQQGIAGRDDEQVLLTQLRLASVLAFQDRFEEALLLVDDVLTLVEERGASHPLTRRALATRDQIATAQGP